MELRAAMQAPSSDPPVFVACAFKDAETAEAAVRSLLAVGVTEREISIGAAGALKQTAADIATRFGIGDDVDADDPLAGAPGLASAAAGGASIDRGGIIGAFAGTAAGLALSFVHRVDIIPVGTHYRALAYALLFLIIGALAGATLGGALAPQRSTHAAFRIVDEVEHKGFALVARIDAARAPAAAQTLEAGGGLHVMSVPASA